MIEGQCYCGEVRFTVAEPSSKADVVFAGYCHCLSCRRAHAAPVYQVAYLKEHLFAYTAGEELVKHFRKVEGKDPVRSFCSNCGSKLTIQYAQSMPGCIGTFPALYDEASQKNLPELLKPSKVNERESCVLDNDVLKLGK
eukprot:3855547-Rhodomonas_salina.1